jgi:hypothetical protein
MKYLYILASIVLFVNSKGGGGRGGGTGGTSSGGALS